MTIVIKRYKPPDSTTACCNKRLCIFYNFVDVPLKNAESFETKWKLPSIQLWKKQCALQLLFHTTAKFDVHDNNGQKHQNEQIQNLKHPKSMIASS